MARPAHGSRLDPRKPLALAGALGVTFTVMLLEAAGGLWTGSLALLADAGHMATDAAALALSLFALWVARRPPDEARTFGYHRVEVLAALANALGLWLLVGALLREAAGRLASPPEVKAGAMLAFASAGLAANLVSVYLLRRLSEKDLNIRGAYLHVLSDSLGSAGAISAAALTLATGWRYADPLMSVAICGLLAWSSFGLMRESVHILLEGAPSHLDLDAVRRALEGIEGVVEVHDLHLWSLSRGNESMTGHLVVKDGSPARKVLRESREALRKRFGLDHVTLQVEEESEPD